MLDLGSLFFDFCFEAALTLALSCARLVKEPWVPVAAAAAVVSFLVFNLALCLLGRRIKTRFLQAVNHTVTAALQHQLVVPLNKTTG